MKHSDKYIAFDLLRGIAALLVCTGHIRNFLFVDFEEVKNPNGFDKLFYFATGLGHQAVIVFFVLSGFFVGGSVWKQLRRSEFSWGEYLLARLSRLWVVLIPALLATWCFDSLGEFLIDNAGYDGRWQSLLSSGPGVGADSLDLSPLTLLGNVFFLQTVTVPVFGTNGPLWSLANEFWYYMIFPFVAIVLHKRSIWSLLALAIIGMLFANLPVSIQSGFVFWLMGWFAAIAGRSVFRINLWQLFFNMFVFVVSLASTKLLSGFFAELVVAVSTAILLFVLPRRVKLSNRLLERCATGLSDMSYSLYLFHFPFVAFCWYVFVAPSQMQPSIGGYGKFFLCLMAALIFCFLMWRLFERQTSLIRDFLKITLVKEYKQ
jgi:peptidoglycan/LPS O-acetylase OafA/YrhL